MKFKTTLLKAGKTATGFEIPAEIVESCGVGKKPPVKVTINGYTYRNTVAVMGGVFMLGVSAEHRKGARVEGGDEIEVRLELDTEPRTVEVPAAFKVIMDKNTWMQEAFDELSYSKKKAIVLPIMEAKGEDTRNRRIVRAIGVLKDGL
jgi:hypothetical protein